MLKKVLIISLLIAAPAAMASEPKNEPKRNAPLTRALLKEFLKCSDGKEYEIRKSGSSIACASTPEHRDFGKNGSIITNLDMDNGGEVTLYTQMVANGSEAVKAFDNGSFANVERECKKQQEREDLNGTRYVLDSEENKKLWDHFSRGRCDAIYDSKNDHLQRRCDFYTRFKDFATFSKYLQDNK
ncbi:MAG TPA: hypothetical protein VIJ14_08955 [Rhabdochlamydiaceae bacterium]